MNIRRHTLIALALIGFALSGQAQPIFTTETNNNPPKPPTFDYVTVDPFTGITTLYWTGSIFDPLGIDPQLPRPAFYIIYKRNTDAIGNTDLFYAIDTVSHTVRSYTDPTANGNESRQMYKIAALSQFMLSSNSTYTTSPLTIAHGTIWLTSSYDTCNATLNLYWEPYDGWLNEEHESFYRLYHSTSGAAGTFAQMDTVDRFARRYTIRNIAPNTNHYFYLTSSRTDTNLVTSSNIHHIYTHQMVPPSQMTIDSIIALDNSTEIYFRIDPGTDMRNFRVMRWEAPDTSQVIFSATSIAEFDSTTLTHISDASEVVAERMRPYYYKVDAVNSCDEVRAVSNLTNTIVPIAEAADCNISIRWTPLHVDSHRIPSRTGNTVRYTVYRMAYTKGASLDAIGNWTKLGEVTSPNYSDDVSRFQYQTPAYQFTFRYYIEGREYNAADEVVTYSRSRSATVDVPPVITVPSAIAPTMTTNINGRSRGRFEPVINFDAEFTLTIYDRWGKVVYHGNEGWDGRMADGTLAREGTYIYRLEVTTQRVGNFTKRGSVSVVYPA